jgi:uncharacterized integral membrane protein
MFFILLVLFIIFLIVMPRAAMTVVSIVLALYFWYITLPLVIILFGIHLACALIAGVFGRKQ